MKYSFNIIHSKIFVAICLLSLSFSVYSCSDFLKEEPHSFLTTKNAFKGANSYNSALADLFRLARGLRTSELYSGEGDKVVTALYGSGTDLGWYWNKTLFFGDYNLVNPTNSLASSIWEITFKMINDANLILANAKSSSLLTNDQKILIKAQARWFRAYAYRFLVYLFGPVPIIKSVNKSPKFDFTRDPKKEVLQFMQKDFEFAVKHLPKQNPGDGHLSKAAANNMLAETYISLKKFDKAITAASKVINDPQYHLMKNRFGNFTSKPGDVFSDLFRLGNQNRSSGNKESILVWQVQYGVPGGEPEYRFERAWGPFLENLKDPDGKQAIIPSDTIGRPVGFFRPSNYLAHKIWQNDNTDIRNSKYNMKRKYYNNNPESKYYKQLIVPSPKDTVRRYYVWVQKAAMPYGLPQGYDSNGHIYTGIYAIRLSETYLLRAEAYLDKGNKVKAAKDINVVRKRAHAPLVAPKEVDIGYILDERARELVGEEPRRLTLSRLGLLYKRVKKYNPVSAPSIHKYNNLLPIPQTAITSNSEANFKQNPGYK